jgi:hypothetical protein
LVLLEHLKARDAEIYELNDTVLRMKEDSVVTYKAVAIDPIDVKLAKYINRAPFGIRSKMNF